jgi:signal transduction histidine kinase
MTLVGSEAASALADAGRETGAPGAVADDGACDEISFEAGVSTKQGGWGVGLALSRRIITELHRGRISARNRERGGTVFDILLPVSTA